jgi:hypothetical protein
MAAGLIRRSDYVAALAAWLAGIPVAAQGHFFRNYFSLLPPSSQISSSIAQFSLADRSNFC